VNAKCTLPALAACLLAACATPVPTPRPDPAPAVVPGQPDLSGVWDFTVVTPIGQIRGEMVLRPSGEGYTGTFTPVRARTLAVRSLTLQGLDARMTVDAPEEPMTFYGKVTADGTGMEGIVHYQGVDDFPLSARKR